MEIRVLGPLVVTDERGPVAVPGLRLRTLLMLLVAHAGADVPQSRLIDELWGDGEPANAANALQVLVSKLRRRLSPSGRAIVTVANGYRLDPASVTIDATRFETAVEQGRALLAAGDTPAAAAALADGLSLWSGDAYDGAADGVLGREAVRLDQLRLSAIEDRVDADLRMGRHADVVGELHQLVAANPLRERFHGQLMVALYRCGRQADALRAYASARQVLLDELGLDPGPELQTLEAQILRHDAQLDLAETAAGQTGVFTTNLRHPLGDFVGRAAELDELTGLLQRSRLVSIVAPGGGGKTRIATEAARRCVDRADVWIVDLAGLTRDASVVDAVTDAVGCPATGAPPMADRALDRLSAHLGHRPAVLVMDNCEHVIQQAAFVVDSLLRSCGELRVLATTREALRVAGELVWALPPMTERDGVALFADRAARSGAVGVDAEMEPLVREVCERLDGLPLAIELAASRAGALPMAQIVDRLDDRFRLLSAGVRTALPRHQTLRAVVDWSYDLLSDEERRLFDRLAVFAAGWSLEAAEAVAADDELAVDDIAGLLSDLVGKSLVQVERHGTEVRYRMLQTLRLYGRERLIAAGELDRFRRRHAEHFAHLCARGQQAFRGVDQLAWVAEAHREIDNLSEALSWLFGGADIPLGQRMLAGLGPGWFFSGRAEEGWRWLRRGLEAGADVPVEIRAELAICASYLGQLAGLEPSTTAEHAELAVELARQCAEGDGGVDRLAVGLMLLGRRSFLEGDVVAARSHWTEAHGLFASGDGGWSRAMTAHLAGRLAALHGDQATALAELSEAVALAEASGVWWAVAVLASEAGEIALALGRPDEATDIFQRGLRAATLPRMETAVAVLTSQLGAAQLAVGDLQRADRLTARAVTLAEEAATRFSRAVTLTNRARVVLALGRANDAELAAGEACRVAMAAGSPWLVAAANQVLDAVRETAGAPGGPEQPRP